MTAFPKILFNHLPKCAGNTVAEAFRVILGESRVFSVLSLDALSPPEAEAINQVDCGLLFGHFTMEQEGLFPTYRRKFTIIRDPVTRVVSSFAFLCQLQETDICTPGEIPRLSLDEYVRSEDPQIRAAVWNRQSSQLLGIDGFSEVSATDAEDLIRQHFASLERFEVIGIFEQLQQTFDLISWRFAIPRLSGSVAMNITKDAHKPEVNEETLQLIERANRIDRALYNHAVKEFARTYDAMQEDLIAERYFETTTIASSRTQPWVIDFGGPVPGNGWYATEHNKFGAYRWAVGNRPGNVYIDAEPSAALLIRVKIAEVVPQTDLRELEIRVDGALCRFRVWAARGAAAALLVRVPAAHHRRDRRGRVLSMLPRTSRGPAPRDARTLSFAVRSVQIRAMPQPSPANETNNGRGSLTSDDVAWCYHQILGRPPENDTVIEQHIAATHDLRSLVLKFIASEEFRVRRGTQLFGPLDGPAMGIDLTATPEQLTRLHHRIREAWTALGNDRPHHSVLTTPEYLPQNLDKHITEFWQTGRREAAMLDAILARHGCRELRSKTCVEYGCGIGRLTLPLATRFDRVHAYDISANHLALARDRTQKHGINNVIFHLCNDLSHLEQFDNCDVLYSRIVLQHNPPPIIAELLGTFLRSLSPGGIAVFQLPTYGANYRFNIDEYLVQSGNRDMEMHCFPQSEVLAIIAKEGCIPLEVREDGALGGYQGWISNTFVVRRWPGFH